MRRWIGLGAFVLTVTVLLLGRNSLTTHAAITTCEELQSAIDVAAISGGTVELGPGQIDCDSPVQFKSHVNIHGASMVGTRIVSSSGAGMEIASGQVGATGHITDLTIRGVGRGFWTNGVSTTRLILERVYLDGGEDGFGFDVDAQFIESGVRDSVITQIGRIDTGAANSSFIENVRFNAGPGVPAGGFSFILKPGGATSSGFVIRDSVFEQAGLLIDSDGGNLLNVTLDTLWIGDAPAPNMLGLVLRDVWNAKVTNIIAENFVIEARVGDSYFDNIYGWAFNISESRGVFAWGIRTQVDAAWGWQCSGCLVQHEGTLYKGVGW